MIVDTGKTRLLDSQNTYLSSLSWALFTNNFTIANTTVWTDLVEAAWAGYGRAPATGWTAATIVGTRAQVRDTTIPVFANTSGGAQTFYGWALIDTAGPYLIAAENIGGTTIPDADIYALAPAITDTQE